MSGALAVVDFDGTLIPQDSLTCLMREQRLWKDPVLMTLAPFLLLARILLPRRHQLRVRSRFKRRLLERIQSLPADVLVSFSARLRASLRQDLLVRLRAGQYGRIVIASASQEDLIGQVVKGLLRVDRIIACPWPQEGRVFTTCWHTEKVRRLRLAGFLPHPDMHLYTDGRDDWPLTREAERVFFVEKDTIREIA